MTTRKTWPAALAVLALAASAFAQSATPYPNADGTFTMSLPKDWKVEVKKPSKKQDPRPVHRIKITLEGAEKPLYIYLWRLKEMRGPRAMCYFDRFEIMEARKSNTSHVVNDPLPHLLVEYRKSRIDHVYVVVYRRIRRNGVKFALVCPKSSWQPKVQDAFFKAVESLKTTLARVTSVPLGYKEYEKDGYLYYLHSDAKRKDLKALHKFLREEEKAFSKIYGKFKVPKNDPPIIIVHKEKVDAAGMSEAAANSRTGHSYDFKKRLIFAVPLTRDLEPQAYFGSALRSQFFLIRFGIAEPYWLYEGEVRATWVEYMSGRKHPAIYDAYKNSIPKRILALNQVPALRGEAAAEFTNQAFCWVVFLREGPRKYQKAFQSFLKEYGATGDWQKSQEQLLKIDQKKMHAAMTKFAEKNFR